MTSNKRHACEQALPERQDGEEKTSDALLDVLIEADTKPFIYDVDENPPLFMTICFAMQVRIIIILITPCLNHLKTRNPKAKRVLWQTVKTRMKCRIMRHFIKVYTVC